MGGNIIKTEWLKCYEPTELPKRVQLFAPELGYGEQKRRTERF
jgi:hypothetical protein